MPLPDFRAQARHVVSDPQGREFEVITWWVPEVNPGMVDLPYTLALLADIDTNVGGAIAAQIPAQCQYVGTAIRMNASGVIWTAKTGASQGPGVIAGDVCAAFVAAVIQKFSGAPGRSGMGRWFIPCVPENFTAGSLLTAGGDAAYATLAASLAASRMSGGDTWKPAHYSRKQTTLIPIVATSHSRELADLGRREVHPLF